MKLALELSLPARRSASSAESAVVDAIMAATTLLAVDSFQAYHLFNNGEYGMGRRWTIANSTGYSLVEGFFGAGSKMVQYDSDQTWRTLERAIAASGAVAAGYNFMTNNVSAYGAVGTGTMLMSFDSVAGSRQSSLNINASGGLEIVSNNVSRAASATGLIVNNTRAYIEWEIGISDAAGYAKVWVNNVLVIDATAIDTKEQAGSTAASVRLTPGTSTQQKFSDFYAATARVGGHGTGNRVVMRVPSADVGPNDWTPDAGGAGNHWTNVDDRPFNTVGALSKQGTVANIVDRFSLDNPHDAEMVYGGAVAAGLICTNSNGDWRAAVLFNGVTITGTTVVDIISSPRMHTGPVFQSTGNIAALQVQTEAVDLPGTSIMTCFDICVEQLCSIE